MEVEKNLDFLIGLSREEYEAEFARSDRLQEKNGIFLSLMGTLLSIVLVSFPYSEFSKTMGNWYAIALLIVFLLSVVCFFIGLLFLCSAVFLTQTKRLNYNVFSEKYVVRETISVKKKILSDMQDIVRFNKEKNDKIAKRFSLGIRFSIPSMIAVLILFIVISFVI